MTLDKQLILDIYLDWVNTIADDLPDKSGFTAEELVYKVCEIIETEYKGDLK